MPNPQNRVGKHPNNLLKFSGVALNAKFFVYTAMVSMQVLGSIFGFGSVSITGMFTIPAAQAAEGISHTINYQGKLMDSTGNLVADGNYNMAFVIYDAASVGNQLWSASTTNGLPTGTTSTISVTVTSGLFSVLLGDVSNGQVAFPDSLFNNDSLYLGVTIGADSEMLPRKRLSSVPYSYNSEMLQGQYASSTVAATGGDLFALHQGSADSASSARTALYIETKGTSNLNDFLIRASNSASDVFTINREGNVTTTGNLVVDGSTKLNSTLAVSATSSLADLSLTGRVNSNLLPYLTDTYNLGNSTYRWLGVTAQNINAVNVSSTNIDALGYVSTTNLYSSTALLGNATTTNLYNSGTVSTTALYVNGVAITGAGATPTWQQVTDVGATTNKWIQFAGSTSTGNIVPNLTNSLTLGTTNYKWLNVFATNGTFTNVSSTNIDASGYISANTLISNSANLGNVTTTNLYNSGVVSTTQLYVNGVVVTGAGPTATLQQVTDAGATTNKWLQFAGATSTNHFLPGTNNLYNLGSAAYRWANLFAVNGSLTNVTTTNLFASGYVSTTNLYVNGTQITGATPTLQQVTDAGYITNDAIGFAGASSTGHLLPTANITYDLGSATFRWRNLYASNGIFTNVSSTNIDALGYVSTTNLYSSTALLGNVTSTNLYNSGVVSTTQLYVNGVAVTGAGPTATLQQVTDAGATTNKWLQFAGATSTNNIVPSITNSLTLGVPNYKWLSIFAQNADFTNVSTTNLDASGYIVTNNLTATTADLTFVSSTNIDASGYVSADTLISNSANLGNATTTNLYNSGTVSTTQLYVNGVAVTGVESQTLQNVTDLGATTNHWLQFAGATSTNHFLPGTNNLYNLGSASYRWANIYGVNGVFSNVSSTNIDALGYVSTTNLFVNNTQVTPDQYFLQNGNSFGATAVLGTNDFNQLNFETNDSVRMSITSLGMIGIASSTPTARLTVVGDKNLPALNIRNFSDTSSFFFINKNGVIGMNTSTLSSGFQVNINGDIGPSVNLAYNIGASDYAWNNIWGKVLHSKYLLHMDSGSYVYGNLIPTSTLTYYLGNDTYKWLGISVGNVSTTNIDALGYVSTTNLFSNTANLGNVTTTNLYNSGVVSTTQLYVNGVAVTGAGPTPTWQQVTDAGATTNHWLQFAGATSTNHFLPGTNNLYNLGSTSYRWANLFAVNGNLTNATTTNLFASGYVSTTNLYVNGTQITGATPTLQQVTDAGYITNDAIGFAGASSTGHLLPTANITYDLGSATFRWRNLYASNGIFTNVSSTNIDALGYVSTTNLYSSTALLGNVTSTNLYNSGVVSTTQLYVNGVAVTGAGPTATLQQVTDAGATTNHWLQFAGATSTNNIVPNITNSLTLGVPNYKWLSIFAQNADFTNVSTTNLDASGYIVTNNLTATTADLTFVSSTNIDASGYVSADTLISNTANLGNATTTNLYNSGTVSTTQLYVNGVAVTGIESQTLQNVTDLGSTTNHWLQFAGATSTNHFLPGTNNLYNLGSLAYRWANLFAINGNFTGTVTTTNLFASGYVSTTNLYVNGTQITGAIPTLQQVTDAGYITNDAIGFAGASSTGNVLPTTNLAYDLGSSSNRWKDVWASSTRIGTSTWEIWQSNQGLTFSENFIRKLTIAHSGNVGIGVTNPGESLHLSGAIRLGTTSNNTTGNVRWDGGDFTGFDGTSWKSLTGLSDVRGEATGFPNRTDTIISFTTSTRTFSIAPTGASFDFYYRGSKYTKNTAQTVQITDTEGSWTFYFDGAGVLQAAQSFPGHKNAVIVANVYWDATNKSKVVVGEERHGLTMDGDTHTYLHKTVGTRYNSGLSLTASLTGTGNSNVDAETAITGGIIFDEDIQHTIVHSATPTNIFEQNLGTTGAGVVTSPAKLPVYYRSGASGYWRKIAATAFPVYGNGTSTTISYNNPAGPWTVPPATSGYFVAAWIMATNNINEPVIAIVGQRQDNTIATARSNNTYDTLSFGSLPFEETKVLYRVIFETKNSFNNGVASRIVDIQDLRSVSNLPGGTYVASAHGALSGLSNDDHTQYFLLSGRTGGQAAYGGINASENLILDSTSNVTKGKVYLAPTGGNVLVGTNSTQSLFTLQVAGNVGPSSTASYDLGSSSYRWRDIFSSRDIYASGTVQGATMRSYGTLRADGAATFNGTIALGDATADTITATGYFGSNLIPSVNNTYTLGTSALRWKNLYATNVSSTNINASGYVSANTLTSNSANLGNATTTNLYNSGVVSTTQLYVNGVAITGIESQTLQNVTDLGATTNHWLQFAGATSTNHFLPGTNNLYNLGSAAYRWANLFAVNGNLTNVTTTNLFASGYVSTTNLYVNGTQITGAAPTLQQVTDAGYITNDAIGFAGASSTGNVLPTTNNTYDLGSSSYRWRDIFSSRNIYASGTVQSATMRSYGTLRADGAATFNGTIALGDATADTITATGYFGSNLIPSVNNIYTLGTSALRWKNLYATNVSSTNINASGYVSANTLISNSANLGNATTTNLYNSGTVSTTQLYVNGVAITGASVTPSLQQVTDVGATTNKRIQFAGATSTANLLIKGSANVPQLVVQANGTQSLSNQLVQFKNSAGTIIGGMTANVATNIFTGFNSGVSITSGINNSFYGNESGEFVTTGGQNTAVGSLAMYGNYDNITGSYNTAIGGESMYGYGGAAISGDANSALGFQSLTSLTSGYDNTGVGYYALRLNTTGYENTAIGSTALNSNTTGIKNVGIGFQTLYTNSTGTANVAVGNESLYNNDGSNNIAIGKNASFIGTFVDETIAIGTDALFGNSADGNMGIGFNAGRSNLTGTRITAIGHGAMENNSTGNDNIGIGYETSHNNVSGNNNTALGSYALYGNYNNSHSNNTAIGYHSLYVVTTASNNTALGSGALSLLSTGASNTAIGLNAGANLTTGTNNITIGSNVNAISATGNNQLNIGNTLYGTMNNGYVGIGDSSPAALLSVGSGDTFQVNTSGDLAKVNNVTYSWPASQGGVTTYLRNDGSGNLTWQSITAGVTGSGTDNRITRWNGTGAVQDSLIEISDAGHLLPSTTLTYDLGSSSNRWKDVWASSTRIGTSTWDIWQANQGLVISNNNLTNKYFNINNNGNVGIGDSTPAALFTVGNGDTFRVNTSGNLIRINNVPYSWPAANASGALRNDGSGNISFNNNVGQFTNDSGYITAVPGQTLTSAYFWVGNGSNQAAAVTMSGEGTLSNAGVLDVSGLDTADFTTANISQWTNNSGYITSANAFIQNGNSFTANASLGTNDAYNLALETSGVARMTILSTGNVGIGDATPAALLTVGNGDLFQVSSAGYVYAQNGSAGSPSYSFVNDPDTGMYDFSANTIGFGAGGNLISAMENGTTYIYGNGSVGAGVYFTDADRSNGVYLRAHSNFSPNYTITLPISAPGATAFMKSDSSGNLSWDTNSYITAGTAFIQDGNSFGGAATLGTNDSNVLNFETGGVAQMQLGTGGSLFLNGNSNAVQIAVKANASQTNVNPLIGLFNSGGSMIGSLHTDNASNIFVGLNTGRSNTVGGGLYNSFIGSSAGYSNTGGDGNTAIGYQTSYNNLLGSYNTAIGYQSMLGVLTNNNTGNTGIGSYSLLGITSGNYNTALGYYAAGANTSGAFNVALGPFALYQNTNSSNNVAVGSYSLFTSNGGTGNVAVGDSAARILSTGSYVTALGTWSLYNNTASYSTAVGFQALYTNTIGPNNTAVGYNALNQNSSGGQNTAMGYESLLNNGTSGLNTAIGYYALRGATAGNGNTAIGARAMDIATGSYNTAIGNDSIGAAYTGTYSIAIGGAMVNSTAGDYNIGIGHYALDSINNTGADYNIGIGDQALFGNLSGNNNIAIGNLAMQSNTANSYAVGIGFQSLLNSTANYNVAVGYRAGEVISTGIGNISIGPYSGYLLNETGNYNTYMGYNARGTGNYNYSMGLGYNAQPVASGYIHIGENSLTNIAWIGGVRTWSTYSDIRIKRDIVDSDLGLNFILKLRPVKYKAASSTDETLLDGFIADEVHTAMQELGVSFSGYKDPVDDGADPSALKSLGYDLFTVPLVNAVQELYASTTPLWNGIAIDSNFAALEEPFMQVDTDGNIAYKGVSITSKGIATSSTQAFDSYTFSYKGSAWNTDTAQEITTSFDVFNNTISATSSELKFIYTTGTGFTQNLLTITNSGDVHVSGDLHVGRRLYLGSNTSGEASTSTYIFVDDTLSPTSTYIATNADGWQTESTYDYAERYESSEDLIPGDLVTTDPSGVNLVKRATSPSEPLLGIVSTKPGFVTGRHYEGWYPIALAGRVPTRVSTINGAIKAGDYIAASDIPGVGIKATGAGNVIGVALESYDLTEEGLISVFVKPSFSMGSIYKTGASAGTINNYTTLLASTPRVEIEGLAMVLAGATEVHISYGSILHYSMVYATPHASIDGSWWVANRTDTGFDIMFSQPQTHDAEFTWLAKPMNPGTIRFVSNNTNQGVDDLTGQPIGPSLDDLLTTTSTDPATSDPEPATSSTTMVSSIDTTETDATASSTWPVTGGDAVTSPI